MYRSRTDRAARVLATAATFGVLLAGCTDLYFARRDTIVLSGGDAVAANALTQTVDPWPPQSGRLASFNGEKMQSAVQRYRTGKVIPPVNPTTSDVQNQAQGNKSCGRTSLDHAQRPIDNARRPGQSGGAHRGRGIRAIGSCDLRRERPELAKVLLGGAAARMLLGNMIMFKMVNFKI